MNLTISDRQGLSVKLNEQGPSLSKTELTNIRKAVEKHLPDAAWLMLCGSLPPGVPDDFYAKLIEQAEQQGVKTFLDTDGNALLHGIEAKPTLVTPNQSEAERLLNRALITRSHSIEAAQRIKAMGAQQVVLSLGSRGVVAANEEGVIEVTPPRIDGCAPSALAMQWGRLLCGQQPRAIRSKILRGGAWLPGPHQPNCPASNLQTSSSRKKSTR